ncbi:MAG: hypothetical protein FJ293_13775 [Planctomycetes bacterium]|nr:hypothetical protein [Planctomycetota bacterium]
MSGGATLVERERAAAARGGGGGGGSEGGGDAARRVPGDGERPGDPASPRLRARNARLTMYLLLSASTMLFIGLLGAFMVLKQAVPEWPPPGSPPLPAWLAWNSALIVLSSVTLALAHLALRRGAMGTVRAGLAATLLLALAFLLVQWFGWSDLRAAGFLPSTNNFGGNFWLLTTLHFAHAVGGFVLLLRASVLAFRGYLPARLALPVEVAALFWHFVDAAWLVIWLSLL